MHVRDPIWPQRLTTPGADAIAILFALESFACAMLLIVSPGLLGAIKAANPELQNIDVIRVGGTVVLPAADQIADRPR